MSFGSIRRGAMSDAAIGTTTVEVAISGVDDDQYGIFAGLHGRSVQGKPCSHPEEQAFRSESRVQRNREGDQRSE